MMAKFQRNGYIIESDESDDIDYDKYDIESNESSIDNEDTPSDSKSELETSDNNSDSKITATIQSPPSHFTAPLARSSILPETVQIISNKNTSFHTKTTLLPVPKLLSSQSTERKQEPVVISIESSSDESDDVLIDDSYGPEQKRAELNKPTNIVIESEDSGASSSFNYRSFHTAVVTAPAKVVNESEDSEDSYSNNRSCNVLKPCSIINNTPDSSIEKPVSRMTENRSALSQRSIGSVNSSTESQSELRLLKQQLEEKNLAYRNLVHAQKNCDPKKLKDGGKLLKEKVERCQLELEQLKRRYNDAAGDNEDDIQIVGTVKKDIIFSTQDQNIAHLGQKGLETHRIEKALTMDALVSLHSGLATTPSPETMEDPPDGLTVPLMPHQRKALAWLLHREKQCPAGGILADDMGLGKTLTMIALVMKSAQLRGDEDEKPPWRAVKSSGPGHPGKTLVVCPASLLGQWEGQVKQHVRRGRLTTLVHHGTNREGRGSRLIGADIVITTYGVLSQEHKAKIAVFRVAWDRVILDEAHTIRNHKTQAAVAACELEAKHRWCLTGTPVHNKELDLYSLLKFLRCAPFDDLMVWKRWVDNKTSAGTERLNTVVKSILLRRTKEEVKAQDGLLHLSSKEIHHIRLELDVDEFKVYENVMNFSKTLVAQYLQQRAESSGGGLMAAGIQRLQSQLQHTEDVKTHDILVLLLRLRQICCLPGLISAMLEEDAAAADGLESEESAVEDLFRQVRRLTISAPPPLEKKPAVNLDKVLLTSNPVFNVARPSSKMRALIETLSEILKKDDKVVVVSQWAAFLRHVHHHLKPLKVKVAILDGSVPVKNRGALVDSFNDPKSEVRVLLLSLTAGGVGLNLIGGNHLIVMEPHWNPQLESQACDRVYRVGQSKLVHIYKVICKDTIEERIELLQQKKLVLAENILTGQCKKEISKLSLQDLKTLFGLDQPS